MTDNPSEYDETMNDVIDPAGRELLRQELAELPETMPPRAVWERIEAQARAEGLFAGAWRREPVRWLAGAGIAAAVVLAVLRFPDDGLDSEGPESFPTVPSIEEQSANRASGNLQAVNALMVQSQQLERHLRSLPGQPSVMRASTAATISELEDRIAAIDYRLNEPAPLSPQDAEIYWRERVRLMDSLVRLRYAQAQRVSF